MTKNKTKYPLGENNSQSLLTANGRSLEQVNMPELMEGNLSPEDLRIHAKTLQAQAEIAQQAGYDRLAENFYRAAELTRVPNQLLLAMYEILRPGRATYLELEAMATKLEKEFEAPICARFVRQAASVYKERDLLRKN